MHLQDILKELATQFGIDSLSIDDEGTCRLVFDKKIVVDIEAFPGSEVVQLRSLICQMSPGGREAFFSEILEANLKDPQGTAFALDPATGEVVLVKTCNLEKTDYQDFATALEHLVNRSEKWILRVEEGHMPAAPSGDGSPGRKNPLLGSWLRG